MKECETWLQHVLSQSGMGTIAQPNLASLANALGFSFPVHKAFNGTPTANSTFLHYIAFSVASTWKFQAILLPLLAVVNLSTVRPQRRRLLRITQIFTERALLPGNSIFPHQLLRTITGKNIKEVNI